ncbi:MAG: hypothetical protein AAGI14_10030 [Pseudomonadota bacterium]
MTALHILSTDPQRLDLSEADGFTAVLGHTTPQSLFNVLSQNPSVFCLIDVASDLDLARVLDGLSERFSDVPTLVLGDQLPLDAVRRLSKLRSWDLLSGSTTEPDILESLSNLSLPTPFIQDQTPQTGGECYAFVSTVGGAGASLLAVEAAFQIKKANQQQSVCLIDLNFVDGMIATYLNCEAGLSKAMFRKDAALIDTVLLQSVVTPHPYGIDVIACPLWTVEQSTPSREFVLQLLDVACEYYDVVLLDVPRWPNAWSLNALNGCDAIVLISELTVPALNASRLWMQHLVDDLSGMNDAAPSIMPVLNRQKKNMLGSRVSVDQAEAALRQPVFGSIRSDWAAAVAAVNLGQAIGEAKPNSVISKDVSDLMQRVRRVVRAPQQPELKRAS